MADRSDSADENGEPAVVRFPQSRVRPPGGGAPFNQLGLSLLARRLGAPERQSTGHWCSRCKGIWFGFPLEVTCPVCGNRNG